MQGVEINVDSSLYFFDRKEKCRNCDFFSSKNIRLDTEQLIETSSDKSINSTFIPP